MEDAFVKNRTDRKKHAPPQLIWQVFLSLQRKTNSVRDSL